jgi:hypothetical protein
MRSITPSLALSCHPSTTGRAVRRIAAIVHRPEPDALALSFRLDGDLAQLHIPPLGPSRRGDRLWEHTCFEAFVTIPGSAAYHELNFSPSRAWAVHAFARYRDGGPIGDGTPPEISVAYGENHLALDAMVALRGLAPAYATSPLRLALAAVVEGSDGSLSFWALHHPSDSPDFHHRDAFVLALERPAGARAS